MPASPPHSAAAAIDGYLLAGRPGKDAAIAAILGDRVDDERVRPFYRALEAVGARVADEALVAIRLAIAGRSPDDENVRRLRALAAVSRAGEVGDPVALAAAFKRDGPVLSDLVSVKGEPSAAADAAREAYRGTLGEMERP